MILVTAVVGLVTLLSWLSPAPKPNLVLLTTQSSSSVLPPNDFAENDAARLAGVEELFSIDARNFGSPANAAGGAAEETDRQRWRDVIEGIARYRSRSSFLQFWKPTTLIVYVNAIGVGFPAAPTGPQAWLVPEGFDPDDPHQSQLVAVSTLMDAVIEAEADQKLVVFDCQRAPVHSHFGLATREFFDAAAAVVNDYLNDQGQGLTVVYSCGSGEASWPMRPSGHSAFGHYFLEGLNGKADADKNDAVTVGELGSYLTNVSDWVGRHCFAKQTPLLETQDEDAVLLTGTTAGHRGPLPSITPVSKDGDVESELEKAYLRCNELAERKSAPYEWAPVKWRMMLEDVLAAERLYRAGRGNVSTGFSTDFNDHARQLRLAHDSMRDPIREVFSPTTRRFLARCCAEGWAEYADQDAQSAAGEIDRLLADFAAGALSLDDADRRLGEIEDDNNSLLPVEAQFLRLVVARANDETSLDKKTASELIKGRIDVAALVQPQYSLVGPWIRKDVLTADAVRRAQEDRLLRANWRGVSLGSTAADARSARATYESVDKRQQTLVDSFRLRDRLLAELPFWMRFLERSEDHLYDREEPEPVSTDEATEDDAAGDDAEPASETDTDGDSQIADTSPPETEVAEDSSLPESASFPRTAATSVQSLLDALQNLQRELSSDPESMSAGDFDAHWQRLTAASDRARSGLDRLHQLSSEYALDLTFPANFPNTGDTWRRVDALLQLPFPFVAPGSTSDETASTGAKIRRELLGRSLAAVSADAEENGPFVPLDDETLKNHRDAIRQMSMQLFSIALPKLNKTQSDLLLTGGVHRLLAKAAANDDDSDVAFRLLSRGVGKDNPAESPAVTLRRRALAEWLVWQAERTTDDFYAALAEGQPPYFARLANDLVDASLALSNVADMLARSPGENGAENDPSLAEQDSPQQRVRARIQALTELLESEPLALNPPEIQFRFTAMENLAVGFHNETAFPAGTAAVRISGTDAIESNPAASDTGSADGDPHFTLEPLVSEFDESQHPRVAGYFRGHQFSSVVPTSIGDFFGPATVYRDQNAGQARLRFLANRSDPRPLNLLFVLDCSTSMAQEDEIGQPRISSLRNVLNRFISVIDPKSVRVGVRLFGHSVADGNLPEARTDTTLFMRIGELGPGSLPQVDSRLRQKLVGRYSPIFHALIESRQDFENLGEGRQEIVLISDGSDNFARAGEKPGLAELKEAFKDSEIRINTIGYNVEKHADFRQLMRIAEEGGGLDGEAVAVQSGEDLLWKLAGLIGLPGYRVTGNGRTVDPSTNFRGPDNPLELDPGQYVVEVVGPQGDPLDSRTLHVLADEDHVLTYDAGLRHSSDPLENALQVEAGDDAAGQPDLIVLEARPGEGELTLQFGLVPDLGSAMELDDVSVRVAALSDSGVEREWFLRRLPPNVSRVHYPAWRVSLDEWPETATRLELQVAWDHQSEEMKSVSLNWSGVFRQQAVADGLSLVRRMQESVEVDGATRLAVSLTFVAADQGPGITDWAAVVGAPVLEARHDYEREQGIYNVRLILADGARLDRFSVVRMGEVPADRQLTVTVPLGDTRINP